MIQTFRFIELALITRECHDLRLEHWNYWNLAQKKLVNMVDHVIKQNDKFKKRITRFPGTHRIGYVIILRNRLA
jgi:hypothetical protein